MPANYRCRVIKEFNNGKYPYIIASECNDVFDSSEANQEIEKSKKVIFLKILYK